MKKYDLACTIGRFQPFHVGHERVIRYAAQNARRVKILIGSAFQHRSPKNPFTFEERRAMIQRTFRGEQLLEQIEMTGIRDMPYNETAWLTQVREAAGAVENTVLVGYKKPGDPSSYYQDLFPEWDYLSVPQQYGTFNATDIRNHFFQDSPIISEFMHDSVRVWMKEFAFTETFKWLLDETKFLVEYKKKWGTGPFVTTDAVVTQAGHILLVTRKEPPYRGSLALPGGFLNPNERIINGCVRELKEETRIEDGKGEIPTAMLRSFIDMAETKVFDDPNRSARGRIITHAFRFRLPEGKGLWKVRGDDDAEKAQWYPISDLRSDQFMEDHGAIIQKMIGVQLP